MERNASRSVLIFLAIASWLFVALASISYSPTDWPSHAVFPYDNDVSNLCGSAGALVAYYIRYSIGPGIYPVLFFTGVFVFLLATKNRISDVWLRATGIAVIAVAFAAIIHQLSGGSSRGLPEGNGGVIGIASAHFLQAHFKTVGSLLVLSSCMLVGLILAADDLVMRAPGVISGAINSARERVPGQAKMRFKFPEMPKLPSMPRFVTRDLDGTAALGTRPTSIAEDDEDGPFKPPVLLDTRPKKQPPPPTDNPQLRLVPAPDADVELDFPADDAAHNDPNELPPSEHAIIPEPTPPVQAAPEVRRDIVVRLPSQQKPKQIAPPP
ncbi:MAG: DNA translocase FtsK 4TM domain-containing protein, partial [Burkholderiales bacterium]|nr:DNA translocase FtsK 4TM domain-containing protein [Phycisphaerae bacterium]